MSERPIGSEQSDSCDAICPYCGESFQVEGEDYGADGEEREVECSGCCRKFYLCETYSITHISRPDCALNGEEHDYVGRGQGGLVYWVCKYCENVTTANPGLPIKP